MGCSSHNLALDVEESRSSRLLEEDCPKTGLADIWDHGIWNFGTVAEIASTGLGRAALSLTAVS